MKCLTCSNLVVSEHKVFCPTTTKQPHIIGTCMNCPYKDAYGIPGPVQTVIINLITHEEWIDGSSSTENCPNYVYNSDI